MDTEHLGTVDLSRLPTLDIGKAEGHTCYIDFIPPSDLTSPVMQGKDVYDRKFPAIKGTIAMSNGKKLNFCETFFQRYTGGELWMGAGHYGMFMFTEGGMSPEQHALAIALSEGKEMTVTKDEGSSLRFAHGLSYPVVVKVGETTGDHFFGF